jgi:glycerophosphoryl diester phosphodiesterase
MDGYLEQTEGILTAHPKLSLPGRQKPYVMAHRGNQKACPENTLAAFQQAFSDGADILETDLHLSRDGVFMCIHDATLDRTTDGRGAVAEKTLAELKKYRAGIHHPMYHTERIPTLAETAAILPGDVALALELKAECFREEAVCRKLLDELKQHSVYARSVVISFYLEYIRAIQAVDAHLPVGLITEKRLTPLAGVQLAGPIWPLVFINPFYVHQAHALGQVVCPLDPEPDRRLPIYQMLGCDAVVSNNPAVTCRLLGR